MAAPNIRGLFSTRGHKRVGFEDMVSHETVNVMAPFQFYDDFLGADGIVLPATATAETGCKWGTKVVGTTTVAGVAPATVAGGVIACTLGAQNEKQDAALYFTDNVVFPLNDATATGKGGCGLIFEARCRFAVIPAHDAGGEAHGFIGMAAAWADNGVVALTLNRIGFRAQGANLGLVYAETDDGTTDSGLITTGKTVLLTEWHVYRFDASNPADVRFYIDGARVCASTTFTVVGAPTASVTLQPYLSVSKTSHEALATLYVDYVRIWANRP